MTFKRLLILGGAALLVAGCSNDVTSPISRVDGAASVRSGNKPGTGPVIRPMSMEQSDSTSCKSAWPIVTGAVGDSTCVIE